MVSRIDCVIVRPARWVFDNDGASESFATGTGSSYTYYLTNPARGWTAAAA
jgi:hypothetical protein